MFNWARVLLAASALAATSAAAQAAAPTRPVTICDLIEQAAHRHSLPVSYFTRLIWQESRFKADALSPAGALGVAQFMPDTASERGLRDPTAEADALFASSAFLAELRATFGNLGLAAAAYNAGPGRVQRWLAQREDLPPETQDYVIIVTGHMAEYWADPRHDDLADEPRFACARIAQVAAKSANLSEGGGPIPSKAWAVVLVANPIRAKVLEEYAIVRGQYSKLFAAVQASVVRRRIGGVPEPKFIVQIERDSRAAATDFCSRLMRAGGSCVVLANR